MLRKHFISLSIFQIMAQFRRGIFYFFLSIYLKEYLQVSNTEMTLFATLPMIANIASQSGIWGRISDKFKKRRLLIIFGELYAAIGYLVVYWIHKGYEVDGALRAAAYTIIIGFTIIEAGWSSSNLGWTTLIADLTEDSERSRTMGLLQFVGGIGNVLGVTASGFIYLALFLIPESYADLEGSEDEELAIIFEEQQKMRTDSVNNGKQKKWEWKIFIWLLVILAIVNIGGNSINQLVNIHVRLPYTFNASDIVVAQLRNTTNISMIIAGLVIGYLTKKFGDGRLLLAGFILAFVGTMALPFAPHIVFIFIYMACRGFTRVWVQTTSYSMVNRVVPLEKRGKMMGYFNATFYLSWGLGGTIITGPIADSIVSRNITILAIYASLAILFVGMWIYIMVNRISRIKLDKKLVKIIGLSLLIGLILLAVFTTPKIGAFIVSLGTAIMLLIRPLETLNISPGNPDAFAYVVTFLIAAFLILVGILTYILYRPKSFSILTIDKNKRETIKVKS